MAWKHPTGRNPKTVTLVALGPTQSGYIKQATLHTPGLHTDEVWTINTALRWLVHDVGFVMDDMQEYAAHFPHYGKVLRAAKTPIITPVVYPEFPTAVEYPLAEIVNRFPPRPYFNNSVPYIIAYAMLLGVEKLYVFGADYSFPGENWRENGRACVEYWIGQAEARGMEVHIAAESTLCDTRDGFNLYGYLRQPRIVAHDPATDEAVGVLRPTNDRISTYRNPQNVVPLAQSG